MTGSYIQNATEHLNRGERHLRWYRNGDSKDGEAYKLADLEFSAGNLKALLSIAAGVKRLNDRIDEEALQDDIHQFEQETHTK